MGLEKPSDTSQTGTGKLSRVQKQPITALPTTGENKGGEFTKERHLTSTQWTVYNEETKQTTYSTVPTSDTTAGAVAVDGFTISQTDNTGIRVTNTRHYSADGMTLTRTNGRGNATTTETDKAGRTTRVTDAAGNTTSTEYHALLNQPVKATDAQGNTTSYRYDVRGRKVAEWGTAIQPACFSYDEANRMTSLTTFRAGTETVSPAPSERTDGDTTTWSYHDASGLETRKTYADGSHVDKAYDAYNRLSVETLARGITKTHSYEHARGLLLGTAYSDGTTARSYTYNHLGQLTQVTDDAGTRTIGYNRYGEQETDSLLAGGVAHLITENRDTYGRSTGYAYNRNGTVQQTVTTGYGSDGRLATASFLHKGAEKQFGYSYLPGSNLLQTLTMPNGITLEQSYEANRDLLIGMAYRRGTTGVVERAYTYDALGRPLTRRTARKGATVNDTFTYNTRGELTEATVSGASYSYAYDNIGNRKNAQEAAEEVTAYTANALNQYTAIDDFVPNYDADGNQTLVKTSTGIWTVAYNAENRPVIFTKEENGSTTEIACSYDYQGRRATKKVTVGGNVTLNQRYIYRGYLQIACCDLTRANHPCLWLIAWDPTQPAATRPLVIQKSGTWYCYGWDLTKNIYEVFGSNGYINTIYTYTPYGEASSSGSTTQPLQWSSEFYDDELGMVYYNFRHYHLSDGRWIVRDFKKGVQQQMNPYQFATNQPPFSTDYLGLDVFVRNTSAAAGFHWKICVTKWKKVEEGYKGDYCCWKKQKYVRSGDSYCIGFGPHQMYQMFPCSRSDSDTNSRYEYGNPKDGGTPMPPEMQNVNGVGANGVVTKNNHPEMDRETGSQSHLPDIKTSCGEDIAILAHFEGQVEQTADYYFVGNKANCRWYAFYMYNYVIKNIINPGRTK